MNKSLNDIAKTYVITGSNKGIGYALVDLLCQKLIKENNTKSLILATSRQEKLGLESVKEIGLKFPAVKDQIIYHQLDVTKAESVKSFTDYLSKNNHTIDVLFNNAGILYRDIKTDLLTDTKEVLNTNYFSVVALTESLIPFINPYGHILNVTSLLGTFVKVSDEIRKKFDNDRISKEELVRVYKEYLEVVEANKENELGWVNFPGWPNSYCISKMFLNAYSRSLAWNLLEKKIRVNVFTPGWCKTDMGGPNAYKDMYSGAAVGIWLLDLEENDDWSKSQCKYYEDFKAGNF